MVGVKTCHSPTTSWRLWNYLYLYIPTKITALWCSCYAGQRVAFVTKLCQSRPTHPLLCFSSTTVNGAEMTSASRYRRSFNMASIGNAYSPEIGRRIIAAWRQFSATTSEPTHFRFIGQRPRNGSWERWKYVNDIAVAAGFQNRWHSLSLILIIVGY